MSKKTKKVKEAKKKVYIVTIVISILLVILLILFGFRLFAKDYYKVESRVDKVKENKKINDVYETSGWLRVQGTDIDLPVLYSKDFSEQFPMELEEFVWTENKDTKFHNNTKIMGHNLYNLSASPKLESEYFHRFEQLMSFVYYDFAKDNKYIQYTVDGKDYVYKIFAVSFIDYNDKYRTPHTDDCSKSDLENIIDRAKKSSIYDYKVDVNGNDKVISLSTCTRMFGQKENVDFYVFGRLVRDGEKINNYRVIKNDNYKKVEKVLKGDEKDEKDTL